MINKALYSINKKLCWQQTPTVECPEGYVRIQVIAAGLNRADLMQIKGRYQPPIGVTDILGLECTGVIIETNNVTHWQVGDNVCALVAGGAIATEVVVDARHLLPAPENISLVEAAVLPEVFSTAWLNLFQLGKLQPKEKVLIHAGASGVGSAAIQLCKAFNNPCWVTVSSQAKLEYCNALGAEGGVLHTQNLLDIMQHAPFDVILDSVGGKYVPLNLDLLGLDSRWLLIASMGGDKAELNFAKLLQKRIQITGSTLRNRTNDFKAQLIAELAEKVWPRIATKDISSCLSETFSIQQIDEAFQLLESNQITGKIAVIIDDDI